jgi:hypothetical protein
MDNFAAERCVNFFPLSGSSRGNCRILKLEVLEQVLLGCHLRACVQLARPRLVGFFSRFMFKRLAHVGMGITRIL